MGKDRAFTVVFLKNIADNTETRFDQKNKDIRNKDFWRPIIITSNNHPLHYMDFDSKKITNDDKLAIADRFTIIKIDKNLFQYGEENEKLNELLNLPQTISS